MSEELTICYEVKDWSVHFENSESRRYKSLAWLPVKNKHDGKGYRRLCQNPKSVQVFCAWILIIQVASKMPTRGLLADGDGPLTASDLSAKTGFPEDIFTLAFQVLTDQKIAWLAVCSRRCPQMPADARQNPVHNTEQNKTEQTHTESVSVIQQLEVRLNAVYRPDGGVWTYAEQSALAEIARRPNAVEELDSLLKYRHRLPQADKRFFPNSIGSLLSKWTDCLDRASLSAPAKPIIARPPAVLKGERMTDETRRKGAEHVAEFKRGLRSVCENKSNGGGNAARGEVLAGRGDE